MGLKPPLCKEAVGIQQPLYFLSNTRAACINSLRGRPGNTLKSKLLWGKNIYQPVRKRIRKSVLKEK
jgi:hypothetical protein